MSKKISSLSPKILLNRKSLIIFFLLQSSFGYSFDNDIIIAPKINQTVRQKIKVGQPQSPAQTQPINSISTPPTSVPTVSPKTFPTPTSGQIQAPTRPQSTAIKPSNTQKPVIKNVVKTPAPPQSQEMELDLSSIEDTPSPKINAPSNSSGQSAQQSFHSFSKPSGEGTGGANLKFFFDFMYRSGVPGATSARTSVKSFDSFHQIIMAEYSPSPEFTFVTDIGSAAFNMGSVPKFFECDYQVNPRLQLRWGKIWIPFDDMSPHNIFGGRVNAANLLSDQSLVLLPTLWADLGAGLKYRLIQNKTSSVDFYGYVVNGFSDNNSDPTGATGSTHYPNFATVGSPGPTADNNSAKDFGVRLHYKYGQTWGLGISHYRGTYSASSVTPALGLSMTGLDAQIQFSNTTSMRLGYMTATVKLDPTLAVNSAKRGGTYIEGAQKFGSDRSWRLLTRAGQVQADDRSTTTSDFNVVGFSIQKTINPITLSLEYNKDTKKMAGKANTTFWALRVVTAL